MKSFRVVDSHTGGEPTRTIIEGGPLLKGESIADQIRDMQENHDGFRRAIVNEPRGSEVMVGACLVPARDPAHLAGIIFFNNVGYLGMCGHGTIGVVATLLFLGKLSPGTHRFETVAGVVGATLLEDCSVTLESVPSYRTQTEFPIHLDDVGYFLADIAYGGNWFCLVQSPMPELLDQPISELLMIASRILKLCQIRFPMVDHVEIFGPARTPGADSRSFVLCPGGMYDRSPCGTGTSAKLACLAASGKLEPGQSWVQESIIGSRFVGSYRWIEPARDRIVPSITGRAFVNADSKIIIDEQDPFAWGLPTLKSL